MGYNGRGFPPVWNTAEEIFSRVGYITEKILGCFLTNSLLLHPTKQKVFFSLSLTREQFFFRCIPKHKRIFCSVHHSAEGSVPLWDTAQKNYTNRRKVLRNFKLK